MKNYLKLCVLFLGAAMIFGCGQKNSSQSGSEVASLNPATYKSSLPENDPATGNHLVRKAKSAIGTPYVSGGSAPGGFDCSGLVQWAYNSVGVDVPRTAREQASVGHKVRHVKDMRAGDIVAFRHPKRGYHTGIYVGDGKFVHSPRRRSHVRINSLSDPYFSSTLLGARRVSISGSENLLAQADGKLEEYVAKKSQLHLSAKNLEKIRATARKHDKNSKTVASKTNAKNKATAAKSKSLQKKSTIATNASKIKSVKALTGKTKTNTKNSEAHAKLASASKKATANKTKTVSMLTPKKATKAKQR